MAFKASNQITFTEHKKIIEIQEWYLTSSANTTPGINDTRWTRNIPNMDATNRYLWNYERVVYSLGEDDISDPAIIGVYGDTGTSPTIAFLTNENITLSANSSGQIAATTFKTNVVAYTGTTSVAITLDQTKISGLPTGITVNSVTDSGNEKVIEFAVADKTTLDGKTGGTIKIPITSPISITLDLTWSKVNSGAAGVDGKDGANGANAKYARLSITDQIIKTSKDGTITPKKITITPFVHNQEVGEKFQWEWRINGHMFYNHTWPAGITRYPNNAEMNSSAAFEDVNNAYVEITPEKFEKYIHSGKEEDIQTIAIKFRTINNATVKYEDIITIYRASDGTDGTNGTPASIAFLTNENVTFSADSDGKIFNTTFSTKVVGYSGDTAVLPELGDITGLVDGEINIDSKTNDGKEHTINFSIDEGATLQGKTSGVIDIPVISPVNTTLSLTWNKVNNGADGHSGQDAKYVKLSTTSHTIKTDSAGNLSPSLITITPEIPEACQSDTFQWEYSIDGGAFTTTSPNWINVHTNPTKKVEINPLSNAFNIASTIAVKYTSTDMSNPCSDVVTIYKLSDGTDGVNGQDGKDGKGIASITNYYQVTTDTNTPTEWVTTVPELTPANKYLWNYEEITYTEGDPTKTEAAIIGAYGDSGDGMVTFEIYSPRGFVFKEGVESIDLKIAAFMGNTAITGATYKWQWWDDSLNDGEGGYSVIVESTTNDTFTVNKNDEYALAALKCTMVYDGQTYEDYVSLMNETVIYTSVVKFFDGSNIFYADDQYIVAYIELYQNNDLIETIAADTYCTGISTISGDTISANITGDFSDGDKMYFVCRNNNLYEVVLGEYKSGAWKLIDNPTNYSYMNSLYSHTSSNVIAISKESINKSQNIDFSVFKDGVRISSTSANVIDSNDPVISSSPPDNPVFNQLWLDTSSSPYILKIFTQTDGDYGEWVDCTEQIGGSVFTSKPSTYRKGDLWILAEGEVCGDFKAGSMLRATKDSDASPMMAYLTNESVILAADSNGQVHGTTFATDVVACSFTNLASNVQLGKITGLPSGITYTTVAGLNGKQTITFTVQDKVVLKNTSGAQQDSNGNYYGTITIPVLSPVETNLTLKWTQVDGIYDESTGAKNIELSSTTQIIKVHEGGAVSPSTITITPTITTTDSNKNFYWNFSKDGAVYAGNPTGVVVTKDDPTSNITINNKSRVTITTKNLSVTNSLGIKFRTSDKKTPYYEDVITIYILSYSSTFNAADWVDADAEATELKNNIKQYFRFDADDGLKIGQVDEKFYVNIRSTEMGFYDNSMGQNQKVVSIGNNAATIKNLTVQEGAQFDCDATFTEPVRMFNFMWQEETNGSFSLVVVSE